MSAECPVVTPYGGRIATSPLRAAPRNDRNSHGVQIRLQKTRGNAPERKLRNEREQMVERFGCART